MIHLLLLVAIVGAAELGSIMTMGTTTWEKLVIRHIVKSYLRDNIDPIIKTKPNWYFIESDKVFGSGSSYKVYCTFKVGNEETWQYIVVEDGQVNNKGVIRERLEQDLSLSTITQQKRDKSIKDLLND